MALFGPEPLTSAHDVSDFSCGKPALDYWLKTRALSNQEKGFTAVIVIHKDNKAFGYYGLAPTAIVPGRLPRSIRTGQFCIAGRVFVGRSALARLAASSPSGPE